MPAPISTKLTMTPNCSRISSSPSDVPPLVTVYVAVSVIAHHSTPPSTPNTNATTHQRRKLNHVMLSSQALGPQQLLEICHQRRRVVDAQGVVEPHDLDVLWADESQMHRRTARMLAKHLLEGRDRVAGAAGDGQAHHERP